MIYPQPVRRNYHPKYTLITLASVSYLRSLVVRAMHRHHTGVSRLFPGKNFDLCIISTRPKTHIPFRKNITLQLDVTKDNSIYEPVNFPNFPVACSLPEMRLKCI